MWQLGIFCILVSMTMFVVLIFNLLIQVNCNLERILRRSGEHE